MSRDDAMSAVAPDLPDSLSRRAPREREQSWETVQAPQGSHPGVPALALGAASALVTACGGGGGEGAAEASLPFVDTAGYAYPAATGDADAARFLQQATFSSTPGEIADLRSGGYGYWLARQYGSFPGPTGWDWLETQGFGQVDANSYFGSTTPADYMIWNQILSGPDAMRRRMALALSEFFVVSMNAMNFNWRSHAIAHYWDTLVRNAFGNFRTLLKDVTLHPAMGYFLNTKGNLKEDTKSGRVPDENYGREVMQLFSIGLYALNPDGTVKTNSSNQRIESYTQDDVTNIARVFTGYDFDTSDGVRIPVSTYTIESKEFARKPMSFNASKHSMLEARFLGTTIPAGTPGPQALDMALDTLFNHPNVGPFFARQMIQRLVTSEPSPGYVARVAAKFNNNGSGVRGDLRAVWAAILLDDEARGPQSLSDTGFGKLREPMVRLANWARAFDLSSVAGTWKVGDLSSADSRLGQSPLRSPSVFNFFRPGYVPPGTQLSASEATAPEFQLVSEISVGAYLNYMQGLIQNGISSDLKAGYARELALVTNAAALVNHLSLVLCADQLSPATKTIMVDALNATTITASSSNSAKLNRVYAAVLMVMASAEYLVQK
jgi:uncharacterized protein (DUF1800 family)